MAEKVFTFLLIAWVLLCPVICGNCPTTGHHHADESAAHPEVHGALPGSAPAHDPQDSCSIEQCFCSGASVSPEARTPAVFVAAPVFFESPSGSAVDLCAAGGRVEGSHPRLRAADPTAFISLLI